MKFFTKAAVLLMLMMPDLAVADEQKFTITYGKELDICRDLKNLLAEPENKNFGMPRLSDSEFVIPKNQKYFSAIEWEDIAEDDVAKYVAPGEWLDKVNEFKEKHKDDSVKLLVQKAKVDFDLDGKDEDVLRFKASEKGLVNYYPTRWHCYVSDIEPSLVSSNYNKYEVAGACSMFKYKDQIFQIVNYGSYSFGIEKSVTGIGIGFGMMHVCSMDRINTKELRASKVEDKKWWSEREKFWKKKEKELEKKSN